jgi:general secretion pathway protein A
MYEKFYGFRERPFELGADTRFLFLPEPHREALSNLKYGISSRKGVTVLTGEVGTGKTTLIRAAIAQADAQSLCVHLTNPRLTRTEFFEFLAAGFKLDAPAGSSKVSCLATLEERLIARLNRGEHSTLIVDEVQTVSDDVLEEVRLLTNMELGDGTRLLSVILVGQPEFGVRLNGYALRHLKQRVALRCELRALTLLETAGLIATRIRIAGGLAVSVFTREAVQIIHEASGGIPRVISVLCDNALVTGFATGERPVGSRIVQDVCRDFHIECRDDVESEASPSAAADLIHPEEASPRTGPERMVISPDAQVTVDQTPSDSGTARPLFANVGARRRFRIF